eukprot:CAMPEP_0181232942 /NCGR_PEP_ID=MMETSP1096-20121128/36039_1 /TAXON_ID=156174 ORGANISM="Chrysochromulina ericina, Strain CCMP281" /NCGR_SAMPLE_ID=MMETSP1096 /ASSEMBLY_ACC=CAM_ASM_000453 /LENGTH=64 /DNA_ID=CAMNT_0023327345 /DNA_START=95 /DNA_END=286 /DNA_ORIENTATION=-
MLTDTSFRICTRKLEAVDERGMVAGAAAGAAAGSAAGAAPSAPLAAFAAFSRAALASSLVALRI